jgi:hypothetical protein
MPVDPFGTSKRRRTTSRSRSEVLGRSLEDLPPVTPRLLGLLDELVAAECSEKGVVRRDFRFSRRF